MPHGSFRRNSPGDSASARPDRAFRMHLERGWRAGSWEKVIITPSARGVWNRLRRVSPKRNTPCRNRRGTGSRLQPGLSGVCCSPLPKARNTRAANGLQPGPEFLWCGTRWLLARSAKLVSPPCESPVILRASDQDAPRISMPRFATMLRQCLGPTHRLFAAENSTRPDVCRARPQSVPQRRSPVTDFG